MRTAPKFQYSTAYGNDKTITVPTDRIWRVRSIYTSFYTSATVSNREFMVKLDGTGPYWRSNSYSQVPSNISSHVFFQSAITQTAGLTRRTYSGGAPTVSYSEPLPDLHLVGGDFVRMYDINNIDAAGDRIYYMVAYDEIDGRGGIVEE